jgi:hypothetical protein
LVPDHGPPPPASRWRRRASGRHEQPALSARRRLLGVLLLIGVAACGGGQSTLAAPAQGCGEPFQERLDPDSLVHIFPDADEPAFTTDPPTSGPHGPAAATDGVRTEPLRRSEQVGLLEAGVVLVQHDGLDDDDLRTVEALGDEELVLVAPNADLPSPVVVTAWTYKLLCASVDDPAVATITAFVEEHRDQSPGTDG